MILAIIGGFLGTIYGVIYHYWLPTPITGLIVWGVLGTLGGWVYANDAYKKTGDEVSPAAVGVIVAVILAILGSILMKDVQVASLWAYLGFFGGVAGYLYTNWALAGAVIGAIIGIISALMSRSDFAEALTKICLTSMFFLVFLPLVWSRHQN